VLLGDPIEGFWPVPGIGPGDRPDGNEVTIAELVDALRPPARAPG
jgi:hypothetical protein